MVIKAYSFQCFKLFDFKMVGEEFIENNYFFNTFSVFKIVIFFNENKVFLCLGIELNCSLFTKTSSKKELLVCHQSSQRTVASFFTTTKPSSRQKLTIFFKLLRKQFNCYTANLQHYLFQELFKFYAKEGFVEIEQVVFIQL